MNYTVHILHVEIFRKYNPIMYLVFELFRMSILSLNHLIYLLIRKVEMVYYYLKLAISDVISNFCNPLIYKGFKIVPNALVHRNPDLGYTGNHA